jgi:hypothetical protein
MRTEMTQARVESLSDGELAAAVKRLARAERESTASLIAHLAEFDTRRLYLGEGFPSLFVYCTVVLHLSEHEAYNRIEAARLARRFPRVVALVADGALNLTTVRLVAPHLTSGNETELLAEVSYKGKRDVERIIVRYAPRPAVTASIRKVPTPRKGASLDARATEAAAGPNPSAPASAEHAGITVASSDELRLDRLSAVSGLEDSQLSPPAVDLDAAHIANRRQIVRPLTPDRFEIRFTASAGTCEKLRLATDLMRHVNPHGDLADIVDRAVTLLLEDLARKKCAATARPNPVRRGTAGRSDSRHIPAAVKRAVWVRDGGRCMFRGKGGRRCGARGFLEFHHVRPYAVGGAPTVDNIQLRCRAHNAYESDLFFGPAERAWTPPGEAPGLAWRANSFRNELADGARQAVRVDTTEPTLLIPNR